MAKRNYTTEQIIIKLRETEVLCGQEKTIAETARQRYYSSLGSRRSICL
jgi:hypothetical protein